ncbi:hypothetical protein Cgig2_028336 [Carnegiea gigantea]|uniref:Uncharacterized protein n=1 Tax=Carnegiea gigantea TaxID=171969 RepID=A0A9Q1KHL3_9CARY|nr:hypothetical protein Cgig2_028336 [Carnegiea gigantea]
MEDHIDFSVEIRILDVERCEDGESMCPMTLVGGKYAEYDKSEGDLMERRRWSCLAPKILVSSRLARVPASSSGAECGIVSKEGRTFESGSSSSSGVDLSDANISVELDLGKGSITATASPAVLYPKINLNKKRKSYSNIDPSIELVTAVAHLYEVAGTVVCLR